MTHRAVLMGMLLVVLVACQRDSGGASEIPTLPAGAPGTQVVFEDTLEPATPVPNADEAAPPVVDEAAPPAPESVLTDTQTLPAPEPPAPATHFSNLRFAPRADAAAQTTFPAATDEVCAQWEYRDMVATDSVRRVWYRNDSIYVERRETWDFSRYGAGGTVTDICLYDRIDGYIDGEVDGIDPGTWRVELYLNDTLQQSASFTVGAP